MPRGTTVTTSTPTYGHCLRETSILLSVLLASFHLSSWRPCVPSLVLLVSALKALLLTNDDHQLAFDAGRLRMPMIRIIKPRELQDVNDTTYVGQTR